MPANSFPLVLNGGPVDADLWFNKIAEEVTASTAAVAAEVRKYKLADQSRTNTTAFFPDDDLRFSPPVNTVWGIDWLLLYSATATEDGKLTLEFPAGAVCPWGRVGYDTALAFSPLAFDTTAVSGVSNFSVGGTGATNSLICTLSATVYMGSTPGIVGLQTAQQVAALGTSMTLRKGSRMVAKQMS